MLSSRRNRFIPSNIYLNDIVMSGFEQNMKGMWERIASILNIDEPQPIALYLGYIHKEGSVQIDGKTIRTMTFNQERFLLDEVERYKELCVEIILGKPWLQGCMCLEH